MQNNKHYYLINGKVMVSDSKMPTQNEWNTYFVYKHEYNNWLSSLQPCEIDESEIMKIYVHLFPNLSYNKQDATPIEITDIVEEIDYCSEGENCKGSDLKCDGKTLYKLIFKEIDNVLKHDCPICKKPMNYFKQPTEQPKQVESDAVEFAEWIQSEKWVYNKGLYYKGLSEQIIVSTRQLYKIFKNR